MTANDLAVPKAARIKLLALDVDGVLTLGHINYDHLGQEIKTFHAHDGLGLKALTRTGVKTVIITGRSSEATLTRAQELNISEVWQNVQHKRPVLEDILTRQGLTADQCAYMGDDLNDLACLKMAGLALAPADAAAEVKAAAHWISTEPGGRGAVRQACELIMKSQGTWAGIVEGFGG